jgi:hypothetical protein
MFAFLGVAAVKLYIWVSVLVHNQVSCGLASLAMVGSYQIVKNVALYKVDAPRFHFKQRHKPTLPI